MCSITLGNHHSWRDLDFDDSVKGDQLDVFPFGEFTAREMLLFATLTRENELLATKIYEY